MFSNCHSFLLHAYRQKTKLNTTTQTRRKLDSIKHSRVRYMGSQVRNGDKIKSNVDISPSAQHWTYFKIQGSFSGHTTRCFLIFQRQNRREFSFMMTSSVLMLHRLMLMLTLCITRETFFGYEIRRFQQQLGIRQTTFV